MAKYTDKQKAEAVALYPEHGTAETARRTNIPPRTITRWAREAGLTAQASTEKTSKARAAGAARVAQAWGDFREAEAMGAGATAIRLREAIMQALADKKATALDAKNLAITYGILIDKAELLSGQATERIEHWVESDVDAELRALVVEYEDVIREHRETS